jgi:hypothetical protein
MGFKPVVKSPSKGSKQVTKAPNQGLKSSAHPTRRPQKKG